MHILVVGFVYEISQVFCTWSLYYIAFSITFSNTLRPADLLYLSLSFLVIPNLKISDALKILVIRIQIPIIAATIPT